MVTIYQNYISKTLKIHQRLMSSSTQVIFRENLSAPAYQPGFVEKDKYHKWEHNGLFEAQNGSKKPIFSMVLPPPNVTGKLHLGHALACTVQDVIARRKRSLGHNVLWLPGTDHAGIATQGVVERYLQSTQKTTRHLLGQEKFIKEVLKWKDKHGNTICDQLRSLGCSLDWSRQSFTMDSRHTNAVNTAFIELFKKGLIYRRKALVNWCTNLNSTISDIEIENVQIKGPTDVMLPGYQKPVKFGLIFSFAYKVMDSDEEIVVATTMPETMLGDTAVAVHPNDERYNSLIGRQVFHPFRKTPMPVIGDEFVDMKFGTGAVKITPAHSKIDFEIGQAHQLPVYQVINEDGNMVHCDHLFLLKNRYECRELILKTLKDIGLLRDIKPHEMTLPKCSRTGDVIYCLPKEQWFVMCSELNKRAVEVLKNGDLKVAPDKFTKTWLQWAEDDRDWCISRQLWWGHQVPAFKCSVDDSHVVWIACTDMNTAKLEASKFLRTMPAEIKAVRDTDVLDTWFSSGIYPFAAMGWPENLDKDYKLYYPLSLMATAHDILGFWVHRMVILGLELTGSLPFKDVFLHGIICDSKGAKMSKSRGNVIDPVDVINGISLEKLREKTEDMNKQGVLSANEMKKAIAYHKANFSGTKGIPECGVDALRFTLLSQDVKSHFVNFDVYQCNANKLFCNKIWQSVKYTQISFDKLRNTKDEITLNDLTYFDKWILSKLAYMVEKVNNSMDNYDFHLAAKALRTLIYSEFCDVYLEATKSGFESDNVKTGYAHAHTLSAVLNTSLRSLCPFMIYLTHELIPKIPAFENNIIHNFNDLHKTCLDNPMTEDFISWRDESLEKQSERLLKTLNLVRELKGLYGISNKIKPSIAIDTTDETLAKDLELNRAVVLNLTRCSVLNLGEAPKRNYVQAPLDKTTKIGVEILGDDFNNTILSARSKLEKKIKKLEQSLAKLEEKFSNSHYLTTVPQWTQIMDREQLSNKKEELDNLRKMLSN